MTSMLFTARIVSAAEASGCICTAAVIAGSTGSPPPFQGRLGGGVGAALHNGGAHASKPLPATGMGDRASRSYDDFSQASARFGQPALPAAYSFAEASISGRTFSRIG